MAKMIPEEIEYFDEYSGEQNMFEALKKLPDDYYVFHSYRVFNIENKRFSEYESDFMIFNPKYGCLFIEAKNGHVYRDTDGSWHYSSGIQMKDPFNQSCITMYEFKKKFDSTYKGQKYENLLNNCKFMFCVWFPAYTKGDIAAIDFGPNVLKELILTKEALDNPTVYIKSMMENIQKTHAILLNIKYVNDAKNYRHKLSIDDSMVLFNEILCPAFDIVPNKRKKFEKDRYTKLLKEQCVVLDFLSEQKSAAISGASGTGKTLVALTRAQRLNSIGEKVLFLCYNSNLKNFLQKNYAMENVDFYTLDGLACKLCKTSEANYNALFDVLFSLIVDQHSFQYKHIIVDEGQDFGILDEKESAILELLADYSNLENDTSFFIFYDKNQLVNGVKKLPSYLQTVDSKLTLYKNCRNTISICKTAYSLIDQKPEVYAQALDGEAPKFYFYENIDDLYNKIDNVINKLSNDYGFDTVILTCKGINSSSVINKVNLKTGQYLSSKGENIPYYSVSTFKGLEADNVILIDVDKETFNKDNFSFYVGASRARKNLCVFLNISDEEAKDICINRFPTSFSKSNKKNQLSLAMGAFKVS